MPLPRPTPSQEAAQPPPPPAPVAPLPQHELSSEAHAALAEALGETRGALKVAQKEITRLKLDLEASEVPSPRFSAPVIF